MILDKVKRVFSVLFLFFPLFLLPSLLYGQTPVADFSGTPTSGIKPLTVQFTDLSTSSTGPITSWSWDFGDTGTSTEQNPFHTYTSAGIFTVTLTVTDSEGSDIEQKINYITVSEPPPVADFSGTPTSGIKPLTVQFTDSSTGTITSRLWNFGDGGTSSLQNPSHLYVSAGSYTVTLTVTGPGGSNNMQKVSYITVNEVPPVADFSADRTSGIKPLTVQFTDKSTYIINSWLWDFGDGSTSTAQNPYHTYASVGTYTVTLTVTGPGGSNTMQKVDYIHVTDIIVDHSPSNVSRPRIAADGLGHVYAVWEDTRNGSSDIYFNSSSDYGFTWQETDIRLDTDTPGSNHSRSPQIACDNSRHVYVVWEDERNGSSDIYFNYSSDYGAIWQISDKKLSTAAYAPSPQFPKIACDNVGHVYVAWDDNYFNTSADNGLTWLSQARRISISGGTDTQLTCDQNGHVYIAWRASGILFNYSTNYGNTWQSSDKQMSDTGAIPYGGLSLASDESGQVYCTWHDGRNNTSSPDIYFDSSSDYGNTWGADIMLNTGTPGATYSIWPEVACDETGHVYVAWYDRRNGLGDIYLNFSSDNGINWQVSDKRLDTDSPGAVDSGYPVIASDDDGHVSVIWTDDQAGISSGLYMNYSLDFGANWLSANRKIGSGGFNPQMVTDGSRFYIVWDNDNDGILFNEVAPLEVSPFPPADPSPVNEATQVSLTPLLSWRGGDANLDDTLTYDIYFGSSLPLPSEPVSSQAETAFTIATALNYFTTYYWQVVAKDGTGAQTAGPIWSFTTMSGPPQFVDFSPPAGATGVGLTPTLSWTAIDPDPGDTLIYAVFFGRSNPPPLQSAMYTSNTYKPGLLLHYTVYYWKIIAKDNHGTLTEGPVMSFTTVNHPPQFYSYSPANGATGVKLDDPYHANLKWYATDADGDDTIKYDIYFGTSSPPPLVASNQTGMSYYTGPLTHMTVYYWKVVARDNHGAETELPVLTFTTLDNAPEFLNYSPVHMSTGVNPSPTLQWTVNDPDSDDTLTYDVYFGTSSSPPLVRSNQTAASYKPGNLSYSTRYYWKVVARDPHGAETTLDVLYFTTAASDPPVLSNFSPSDHASGVELSPTLSWSGSDPNPGDTLTYDVYFGYYSPPPKVVSNQAATTYQPGNLGAFSVYYWKIVARDNHGVQKEGPILSFSTLNRPPEFQSFTPLDLSTGVPITVALKWSASDPDYYDTLSYNIYFGTSSPPPLVAINKRTSIYKVKALSPLTTYYWQIMAYDGHGTETIGPVLSFTTGNPPHIENISPNPCQTLQVISIFGERFGNTQGKSEIHLGETIFRSRSTRIKMWSDTRIDFQVPAFTAWPSGATRNRNLWVKVNGMVTNKVLLTITKP